LYTSCSTWAAPIAGDCRYWDEDYTFPKEDEKWNDDANLEQAFREDEWMPPKVAIPDLAPEMNVTVQVQTAWVDQDNEPVAVNDETVWVDQDGVPVKNATSGTHQNSGPVQNATNMTQLAQLPRKRSATALTAYAKQGAMLVHEHLRSNDSVGFHKTMQQAMMAVLDAHDEHVVTRTLWKRLTQPAVERGHVVAEKLADAIIDQAHPEHQRRMEAYAIGAAFDAVHTRMKQDKGGAEDARLMGRMWDRIFH